MGKYFNGRETELLAPVGTLEDFKQLLHSGADAFYMGGKKYNMRMHRQEHNLSDEELAKAIDMAHQADKKIYITFNNMMTSNELQESIEFLRLLERLQPDALIIQDLGAIKLIKDEGLKLNMHLSVMANIHNISMVKLARKLGVTRVVTSREQSLADISNFVREVPEMEYEYFIHGDMCSVNGSQCYYSGMLFGKSGNRGLCMKPCRWPFRKEGSNGTVYPFAVKDMCLYRHIPELISSGVNSFKIEGRMRGSDYLITIINQYREAIDRYIDDPTGYSTDENVSSSFYEGRIRNLSTAYAFKNPGFSNIDITGEREPRVFSKPTDESGMKEERINEIKELLLERHLQEEAYKKPGVNLAVKVNNLEAFKKACDCGADFIYISGEVFRPDKPFTKQEIKEAIEYSKDKRVFYVLPRMVYERQLIELNSLVPELQKIGIAGIVAGNAGEIYEFNKSNLEFRGDFSLNVYNEITAAFYKDLGVNSITLSIEAPAKVLKTTLLKSNVPIEIIVQGAPAVMYLDHCLIVAEKGETSTDFCKDYCKDGTYSIVDEKGIAHTVYSDQYCKNHMIPSKDISYLPILKELKALGAATFRIEAQHYTPEQVGQVTAMYREIINHIDCYRWNQEYLAKLTEITNRQQSLQSLNFE